MGIKHYGLFSGRVVAYQAETSGKSPHFQILLEGAGQRFRVAVNTRSGTSHSRHADLLYFADDDFHHEVVRRLAGVDDGFVPLASRPHDLALDYQRGGMFDRRHMRRIPGNRPGPRNDLVDELDYRVGLASGNAFNRIHAFGSRWGPEPREPDHVFGFVPGNGMHDVHMNQGNTDEHWHDNGVWSDGGLLFHEPRRGRWSAIFLAFQTQSWHTDDKGDPIPYPRRDGREDTPPDAIQHPPARIVGAFVHPNDRKQGVEHVAVRNDGEEPLDVTGWRVTNRKGDVLILEGVILPRSVSRFALPAVVPLSNRGGTIRLLDASGEEIDGVSYTRHEARRKHGSLTF